MNVNRLSKPHWWQERLRSAPTTKCVLAAALLILLALSMAQIDDFVSDSNGLRLMRAFMRIDNAALRRRIAMLVQEIAGDDD